MAARTIEVPSFDFSVFYYPQILEALIIRKQEAKAARLSTRQMDQPRKRRPADPAKKKARQERKQVLAEEAPA